MENTFERIYREYQNYKKEYGDNIARKEEALAAYRVLSANLHERGLVFVMIYRQYEKSKDNGNENLNFNDYIPEVGKCVDCLRENGVKRFTFSSSWTGAIENAWELQKAGCRMVGMKEVKSGKDWKGTQKPLAALIFEIN